MRYNPGIIPLFGVLFLELVCMRRGEASSALSSVDDPSVHLTLLQAGWQRVVMLVHGQTSLPVLVPETLPVGCAVHASHHFGAHLLVLMELQ